MSMIDRQQGTKVRRTTRMKCFVCKRDDFVLNSLIYFEPVKRLENGGDMMEFRGFGDSTSSCIQNQLETIRLRCREIKKERVTVVKFRVNDRSSNGASRG